MRALAPETGVPGLSPAVRAAMERVDRAAFVPAHRRDQAWDNRPLPIGHGQTISQPLIVALMTSLLDLRPGDRVLEIGVGCGYQTAILMELGAEVIGIEVLEPLVTDTRARLERLGYRAFDLIHGDGHHGHAAGAPYRAVLVACAERAVPPALEDQLAAGGRLVIPIEDRESGSWSWSRPLQWLECVEKNAEGRISRRRVLPVAFVPFVHSNGDAA